MVVEIHQPEISDSARVFDHDENEWITGWQTCYRIQKQKIFLDAVSSDTTSESFSCEKYQTFSLLINIIPTAGTGSVRIDVEFSNDNAVWYKFMNVPFGAIRYSLATGSLKELIKGDINAPYIRVRNVVSGSLTYTLSVSANFSSG